MLSFYSLLIYPLTTIQNINPGIIFPKVEHSLVEFKLPKNHLLVWKIIKIIRSTSKWFLSSLIQRESVPLWGLTEYLKNIALVAAGKLCDSLSRARQLIKGRQKLSLELCASRGSVTALVNRDLSYRLRRSFLLN